MIEDIDIVHILITNPPVFFKSVGIAIGGGFALIILTYFANEFYLKLKTRRVTKVGVAADDDL